MPEPNAGESEQDFISRCMSYPDMQEYEPKQRAAICYSKFRGESIHPNFKRIIGLFFDRYGVEEALEKFNRFVAQNNLNVTLAYDPKVQFQESFEWVEPLIQPYKADREAKYYLVTALTANISLNNNDYTDYGQMEDAAKSLSWRPVNINHDHGRWLPYPRTRVDFSTANDFSVEATLRVDNEDAWLQQKLDSGEILHPSIEGRPDPVSGYHFTALALLEKGTELPGDPLTEIVPLAFNESVGKSFRVEKAMWRQILDLQNENARLKTQMRSIQKSNKKIYKETKEALQSPPELKEGEYYAFLDDDGKQKFTKDFNIAKESMHNLGPNQYYCFRDSYGNLRFTKDWRIYKEAMGK